MICARLVIPTAVISGLSFHENFLYLSTKGTTSNANMKSPGHATPVTNLSYIVLKKAYSPVRYHSGTVIPGGVDGSNLIHSSSSHTLPVNMTAPEISMSIGTSNTRNLGK